MIVIERVVLLRIDVKTLCSNDNNRHEKGKNVTKIKNTLKKRDSDSC